MTAADRPTVTDNARAETTTATTEDAARVIHETHCVEDEHGDLCIFWGEDHQSAQALDAAGLLARPTPSRKDLMRTAGMYGKQVDAVLALLEGSTDE